MNFIGLGIRDFSDFVTAVALLLDAANSSVYS
jgi:hypothetical protein